MNNAPIKNLILDFGGVLLRIDYHAPIREFEKLGFHNFQDQFTQASQTRLLDEFEKGKISENQFRDELRKISKRNISDGQIDVAWNSILLDFPEEKMKLLESLKKKYRLFLLSNTNEIHIREFERSMNEKFGAHYFHLQFEKIYFSSRVGMRKPDQEIFDKVVEENGLNRAETLFIDDSIQHVIGARNSGLRALHLDLKKEDLPELLKRENLI